MINTTDGFAAEELFSWEHAYIDAYYYAITTLTTVGYGDRTPNTGAQALVATLLAAMSLLLLPLRRLRLRLPLWLPCILLRLQEQRPLLTQPWVARADDEKLFSILTELAGGIVFGVLVSALGGMLTSARASQVGCCSSASRRLFTGFSPAFRRPSLPFRCDFTLRFHGADCEVFSLSLADPPLFRDRGQKRF